jgi:hypothetical protein
MWGTCVLTNHVTPYLHSDVPLSRLSLQKPALGAKNGKEGSEVDDGTENND